MAEMSTIRVARALKGRRRVDVVFLVRRVHADCHPGVVRDGSVGLASLISD
jgi:hypothetical protein